MRMALVLLCLGFFSGLAVCQDQSTEPVLKSSLMPTYPLIAATAHIQGDVVASFVVDVDGTVASVEIVSGPQLLQRATVDNIRSWKFGPINDKPTANKSFETVFYYRISPRNACENNKWLTVSTRSFHEIEITAEVPRILAMSGTGTNKPSHPETTNHQ